MRKPHLAFVLLQTIACSGPADERSIGKLEHLDTFEPTAPDDPAVDAPGPMTQPIVARATERRVGAFTKSGDLALVDAVSGKVLSTASAADRRSPGPAWRDVSWDAWRSRFVVLESNEDGRSGEISTVSLDASADALGDAEHHAWFDGIVRGLPVPDGLVLFQEAYGRRWRLLHEDGTPSPSKIGPLPASAWVTVGADGPFVHAVAHGSEPGAEIERWSSLVAGQVGVVLGYSLDLATGTAPPCARSVAAPDLDGDAVLVDLIDGVPTVRLLDGVLVGQPHSWWSGPAVARIEAAVGLLGGRRVVALASDPPLLVALDLSPDGLVMGSSWLDLPMSVTIETRFWSRDLAAAGDDRVLVAMAEGVVSVHVHTGESGPALAIEPAFEGRALRGPLAAVY